MAKILLVEDNKEVTDAISDWLKLEGHSVEIVGDGLDALQLLSGFEYELIILDWNLPSMSGPEVLKRFRAGGGQTQVIFLTGMSDSVSKTSGLDAGADDYLTKPIDLPELSARIRSRLRRPGQFQPLNAVVGNVQIDTNIRKVLVDGKQVHLTSKEFAVFEFLVRHRGQSFTARALRDNIWPSESEILEDTVRVCIQSIRRKLGSKESGILKTIAGAGYTIDDK